MRTAMVVALIAIVTAGAVFGVACGSEDDAPTATVAAPSPAPQVERVIITMGMAQTSFWYKQKPDPDITVELGKAGTELMVRVVELEGKYPDHLIRFVGADDLYETADDEVSGHEPQEQYGELKFRIDQPTVFRFRCDPHAAVMTAKITVVQAGG